MISDDPPTVAIAVRTVAGDGTDALGLAVARVGDGASVVDGVAVEGRAVEPPAVAAMAIPPAMAATDNPAMAMVMRRFLMGSRFFSCGAENGRIVRSSQRIRRAIRPFN